MKRNENTWSIPGICVLTLLTLLAASGCREDIEPQTEEDAAGQAITEDPGDDSMGAGGSPGAEPAVAQLDCKELPTDAVVCGGNTCDSPSGEQTMLCIVACCTADDTCGIRGMVANQNDTECTTELDAEPDPRCPDDAFVDGTEGIGCCLDDNMCGLIDPVFVSSVSLAVPWTVPRSY